MGGHVFVLGGGHVFVLGGGHVCVLGGIDVASFYDISIGFWSCSESVVLFCVGGQLFMCWGSCIYVLRVMYLCVGIMYLCVGDHVFMCWGSCI